MRAVIVLLALGVASPAVGQDFRGFAQAREAQLFAEAQAARNRDIALANELAALEARLQTEQALSNLQAARATPPVPLILPNPRVSGSPVDTRPFASIPDATLAASNARVRAAADNRR